MTHVAALAPAGAFVLALLAVAAARLQREAWIIALGVAAGISASLPATLALMWWSLRPAGSAWDGPVPAQAEASQPPEHPAPSAPWPERRAGLERRLIILQAPARSTAPPVGDPAAFDGSAGTREALPDSTVSIIGGAPDESSARETRAAS